jgi:pqiA protein
MTAWTNGTLTLLQGGNFNHGITISATRYTVEVGLGEIYG